MTQKEKEAFADLIVAKLISKQKEMDKDFIQQLEASNIPVEVHHRQNLSDYKDSLIEKIKYMKDQLKELEREERYEEAFYCVKAIKEIETEISFIE